MVSNGQNESAFNLFQMTKKLQPYLLLTVLASVLFLPFLGNVHLFDWDEINFAESAREMLLTGDFFQVQINFSPFWEKPPFFIWLQALSMKLFGVTEFAARFPNAVAGLLTLWVIFYFGKSRYNERLAWYWVLAYLGSFTPLLYFKSGIIDPFFNLFIFLSVVMVSKASMLEPRSRKLFYTLGGAFLGLALITKGPASVLIVLLCIAVILIRRSFRLFFDLKDVLLFSFSTLLLSSIWYGVEYWQHGLWFFEEFIRYQKELASESVATHGQPWYYHPIVLLLGVFPASVIGSRAFGEYLSWSHKEVVFRAWMGTLFWVVLILFSIVKTKIIHYSSLCYLPLTFLAAVTIEGLLSYRIQYRKLNAILLALVGLVLSLGFLFLPLTGIEEVKNWLLKQINDPFAAANFQQKVDWPWFTFLPAAMLFFTTAYSVYLLWIKRLSLAFPVLFVGSLLSSQLFLITCVPRIEIFTQGPAIAFLKEKSEEDVYLETLGYKSYAQYFYGKAQPMSPSTSFHQFKEETLKLYGDMNSREIPSQQFKDWLMNGEIDKPAFFISKIQHEERYASHPNLKVIGRSGGFVFYERLR